MARDGAGEERATMRIEVQTFGGLSERVGLTSLPVELPEGATVADLRRLVAHAYPELAPLLSRIAVSVDLEIVGDATVLAADSEVALLPPVAGGAGSTSDMADHPVTLTGLVRGGFDVDAVLEQLTTSDSGALVSFVGTVRDHAQDLDGVVGLDYTAYEAMAEAELERIAAEVRLAHPEVRGLALLHALGELTVGDRTILIAVSSPHRAEAFAACRDALEWVKERVPVFKRELSADGAHRWVGLGPDTADDEAAEH
jgi:molybdopterin synthase catalytic subunit/molybdopterin converting factor small subunit